MTRRWERPFSVLREVTEIIFSKATRPETLSGVISEEGLSLESRFLVQELTFYIRLTMCYSVPLSNDSCFRKEKGVYDSQRYDKNTK